LRDQKQTPPKDQLLQFFSESLDREIFTPVEKSRRKKHGELILSSYYDYYFEQFVPAIATEMALGRGSSICLLEDIQLTGNIDRLDLIDANTKEVKVVDYKTGKAQTRNEIEGKTKNATMHYKRQLVFYRLLGDLSNNFPYKVKEAELDFIEPDNGKFRREKFEITPDEVKELKELIKQTMKKIRSLEFNRTTDTSLCQSCEFLSHCWPAGIRSSSR
jgi:CRISPR/Cas system-associated exonuclease Cas4 (RecB family)